jgi:hypothetical protein
MKLSHGQVGFFTTDRSSAELFAIVRTALTPAGRRSSTWDVATTGGLQAICGWLQALLLPAYVSTAAAALQHVTGTQIQQIVGAYLTIIPLCTHELQKHVISKSSQP